MITRADIRELKIHELQDRYSPWMSENRWNQWFDRYSAEGQQYPVEATADGRIFNGKHRYKAQIELGLANIDVIFYDGLTDDDVAAKIIADKTQKDELTVGQRVAIEINRAEAEGLFEEANIRALEGKRRGGKARHNVCMRESIPASRELRPREVISFRCNVNDRTVQQLITIKKQRPDLFQHIFNGWYDHRGKEVAIGTVYRMMKADEKSRSTKNDDGTFEREHTDEREIKEIQTELVEVESKAVQETPEEDLSSANNCIIRTRRQVFETGLAIMTDYRAVESADEGVKRDYLSQLENLVKSSLIVLGRHTETEERSDIFALCLELLSNNKSEGEVE